MKKSVFIAFFVVFILVTSGFVFGQDANTDEVDEETEQEVEAMDNGYGAKMRLLQLERAIQFKILRADEVIAYFTEKGYDTTELEGIVAELELLADEANSLIDAEVSDETVQSFINIKMDAKELVREFRDLVHDIVSGDELAELRSQIQGINVDELQELNARIQEQRRLLNAERTRNMLEKMGVSDEGLVFQVQSGEITAVQVRQRLRENYANVGEDQKAQIRNRIREAVAQRKTVVQESVGDYVQARSVSAVQRTQVRTAQLEQIGNAFATARAATLRTANAN